MRCDAIDFVWGFWMANIVKITGKDARTVVIQNNQNNPYDQPTDFEGIRQKRYRSFISYSHDESVQAQRFHAMLAVHARSLCPSFLAEKSIAPGANWFDELRAALDSMSVLFVIFSEASFPKHWLHVESGAALILKKRIIPLLHGKISHKELPFPYNLYQSKLRLDDTDEHLAQALRELERKGDGAPS
jgi:hypothetical protein